MNEGLITFLISFALTFIVLMQIVNYAKITRIEKKYVKQVKVIRHKSQINETIKQFEERGWLVENVIEIQPNKDFVEITFIK